MTLNALAASTLAVLDIGYYEVDGRKVDFSRQQALAVSNTKLYTPSQLKTLRSDLDSSVSPKIKVVDGTTQAIACQMANESNDSFALLNFASARNPGGGFLNGAKAQEEDICRCSGLYPCLITCMEYYDANREQDSLLYTDYAIYSPAVPFFKTRGTGEYLRSPFFAAVITTPAPNTGQYLRREPGRSAPLEATFVRRWENVLCIARDQGVRRLLLGAWGCGAFGGDPVMASTTAKLAIERYGSGFEQIVFAIPGTGNQSQRNLDVFKRTFA